MSQTNSWPLPESLDTPPLARGRGRRSNRLEKHFFVQYEWNTVFAGRNWNAGETIGESFIAYTSSCRILPETFGRATELKRPVFRALQSSSFVEWMGRSCRHLIYSARFVTRWVQRPHPLVFRACELIIHVFLCSIPIHDPTLVTLLIPPVRFRKRFAMVWSTYVHAPLPTPPHSSIDPRKRDLRMRIPFNMSHELTTHPHTRTT